ncbi:isocitrate lyase/PEP mutase family protein [Falsiroseomonas oryzae]|uniref:isocitrate lyase/PEP mutase family protein n=1 Tax=Falsiroseomonas oryzae TaxID=2766473 RepID=UPI0022EB8B1B|nr:isocitrate lyase/PEP mutase family protein [Roseomonas sp. MO-31]
MAQDTPAARLAALMSAARPVLAPGVWDGLSAKVALRAAATALHASGGAIARAAGQPDLGIIGLTEMSARIAEIVEAAGAVPVIADADTGYGGPLNVAQTVRCLARLGVAALHLEDQPFPKRCGLLEGVQVVPRDDMLARLRAARAACPAGGPLLIARTDAVQAEGLECALDRMRAYLAGGADIAFVEGLDDADGIARASAALAPAPLLFNASMSATGLPLSLQDLAALRVGIVIYPGDAQRAAIAAMDRTFAALLQAGDSRAVARELAPPALRDELVGTAALMAAEASWSRQGDG